MTRNHVPSTPAVRAIRDHEIPVVFHEYRYEERGGTSLASRVLGVDEHMVIKTLVMETDTKEPFLVLMHGDREVSLKALARHLGVKSVSPCSPQAARKHTGYLVGGTSPFGTLKKLPLYMEPSVVELPRIYINAGRRGLLAEISPVLLAQALEPVLIRVAV